MGGKPMARWSMQETTGITVSDSIGTFTGTATSGNARRFNGTSDHVSFASKIMPLGAKTVRFKFRRNGLPPTRGGILCNADNDNSKYGLDVMLDTTGAISFSLRKGVTPNNFSISNFPANICDNNWHEIMFSWNGTVNANAVKLYIDDMVTPYAQATALVTETTAPTNNLSIGYTGAGSLQYGSFDIDDLWISNGANGGGTVVAWWKMDEAVATTMVDSSSSAWIPTITGTTVLTNDSMPIIVSDGLGRYARRFNGRSDRITFTSQVLPLGAKSIMFKIRYFKVPSTTQIVLGNNNFSPTQQGTFITLNPTNGGELTFGSGQGVSPLRFSVKTPFVPDGNWHNVLCTWDGTISPGGAQVFVDDMNTPIAIGTAVSTETSTATNNLTIGNSSPASSTFEGDLKDIQINVGRYSALMFSDASGIFYSDDLGNILKYLDFGTLIAGQTSLAKKVLLRNMNPFVINNIILWSQHSINGLTVELSPSNAPFVPQAQLTFNQTLTTDQTIDFYVRLNTDTTAYGGGSFDIKTKSGVV